MVKLSVRGSYGKLESAFSVFSVVLYLENVLEALGLRERFELDADAVTMHNWEQRNEHEIRTLH
jgi:hypothetical protein